MKEAYVSFKVAMLLKEKGFHWPTCYYTLDQKVFCGIAHGSPIDHNMSYTSLSVPTQQMAMRWLREEKDIDIIPFHERLPHGCFWCRIEHNLLTVHQQPPIYSTYEDAVEAALQYVLTNLI